MTVGIDENTDCPKDRLREGQITRYGTRGEVVDTGHRLNGERYLKWKFGRKRIIVMYVARRPRQNRDTPRIRRVD